MVLEEFGVSPDFASEPNAARYYRHVLHHRPAGRRDRLDRLDNTDFDLPGQDRTGMTPSSRCPFTGLMCVVTARLV